jgi:cyclopropane-fatty-acyl-phospholipid synthase
MQKQLMHQLLSQVATGSLAVTYWDGTTEQYGNGNPACNQVKTLGITLSEEQYRETKRRIQELALEELVEVELMDYRTLAESGRTFDKVVSIGMLEHVGRANLPRYMASVDKLLAPQGLSLLHTITHLKEGPVNSWIEKYIFPGGYIPSLRELIWLLPEYDFHLLDVESLRLHYAMTLDRWAANFEKNAETVHKRYGERFVRMWRLYLQSCAASFRYSGLDIHQILFSKGLNNNLPLTRHYLYVTR